MLFSHRDVCSFDYISPKDEALYHTTLYATHLMSALEALPYCSHRGQGCHSSKAKLLVRHHHSSVVTLEENIIDS